MSNFSILAKSLKGLYKKNNPKVTLEKLEMMLAEGTITKEEFAYITGKDSSPE